MRKKEGRKERQEIRNDETKRTRKREKMTSSFPSAKRE